MLRQGTVYGLAMTVAAFAAYAQSPQVEPGSSSPAPPATTAVPCCLIPAGTPVEIEVVDLVSSKTAKSGDRFGIKLARDFDVGGVVVLPAGAAGGGEVIDAGPAGLAGRPGKLILAARWLQVGATRVPLRSFKLAGSGRDDSKAAMALTMTPYVGLLFVVIQGGNIDYRPGTQAVAKVAADTFIAPPPGGTSGAAAPTRKETTP